jgi:hypothetical protein
MVKTLIVLGLFLSFGLAVSARQRNTAKTELPGAGPCTNFPRRYQNMEERLAWFYGCMHKEPPSTAAIRTQIAALPPEKSTTLKTHDFPNQEALIGVAAGDLPIQIFPK